MGRRRGTRRARPSAALITAALVLGGALSGCSTSLTGAGRTGTTGPAPGTSAASAPSGLALGTPTATAVPTDPTAARAPVAGGASTATTRAFLAGTGRGGLRGKVVVIDPGHNGANGRNARRIGRQVDIGNGRKACDTTGTQTNAGYTESSYNYDVAIRLARLLRSAGATVVLTRPDDRGVGPCITERAAIGNRARADAAISIHADGAPAAGYGFHVIVPAGIGRNDAIVAPSRRLGIAVRDAFRAGTGEPLSTYTGTTTGGLVARRDLGGLNLSGVPKVFIECGNMRNAADARRLSSPAWRQRAAVALATGLSGYLAQA